MRRTFHIVTRTAVMHRIGHECTGKRGSRRVRERRNSFEIVLFTTQGALSLAHSLADV